MMGLSRPSPPTLLIPNNSRSPAGNSPTTQTGRPPLWTRSAQRKMSRLYLYTTLPITKILDLIYTDSPHAAPGKDSANKKLNAMLDKEPRWLHPKTNTDMGRRVAELSNSPTRSPINSTAFFTRPHSFSDPTPFPSGPSFNVDTATRPSTRNVSPFDEWPASAPTSTTDGPAYTPNAPSFLDHSAHASRGSSASPGDGLGLEHDGHHLDDFLRQTTFMSSSTDRTTGSFHRVLSGYPEAYIRTVRRLVKRFTMPNNNRRSVSPISERPEAPQTSWLHDDDAPSVFHNKPYPLPGDFLGRNVYQQGASMLEDFVLPDSPWMTSIAPTDHTHRLLSGGFTPSDVNVRDAFGNTVLHFFAACGNIELVFHALQTGFCTSIVNEQNSAGQTFLHLATLGWIGHTERLHELVRTLHSQNFNFYSRDHYGRNVFHVLHQEEVNLTGILPHLDKTFYSKRDAFDMIPHVGFASPFQIDLDMRLQGDGHGMEDARLLAYVRNAMDRPYLEDDDGRNGLHCLAMASLSQRSVSNRLNGHIPTTPEGQRRKSQGPADNLDSSEDRLAFRLSLLTQLLDAGVDANHYDHRGNTPLMAFAAELPEDDDYKTGPKILETLVARGANIHARNRAGETALHIAVRCGRKLAVRTLVKCGANVYARDAAARSVLELADTKMANLSDDDPVTYAHYEACRAWLSGQGHAVQRPTMVQEWGLRSS